MLDVRGLHKAYGDVVALDGVDLAIAPGEIVGLLGPNGAGKTTLVSIVCGLRRADSGTVRVGGVDALAHPERARRHIGLAPQELGIYPIDTVRQNLELFAALAGLRGAARRAEVEAVAAAMHLDDLLARKAAELSGGQKRRLHTALALLNGPPLLLLDEATVGADVETRAALIEVVRRAAQDGAAVLYSTHYLHEIEALDPRVVIIDKGRVISEGSVAELVASNGGGVIELSFEGRPPDLGAGFDVAVNDESLHVSVPDPATDMARVLAALGEDASRLRGVDVVNPSLETVFLALTGRRYVAVEEEEEGAGVVAS